MKHGDIIHEIWQRQGGGYAFVSERYGGRWKDTALNASDPEFPASQPLATDYYFTPLTFNAPKRSNENAVGIRCLFADLDPVDPHILSIRPTLAWETSPGNYQALWYLYDEISYSRFANLNRRLTMLTGADVGGWMGSKVLRWPGTLNHKYKPPGEGKLLWYEDQLTYTVEYFEDNMPAIPNKKDEGSGFPPLPIREDEALDYIAGYWKSLSLRGRSMLMKKRTPDRSLHIVRTIHELLKNDVYPAAIFQLIWWRPWNKWRTDRHRPEQLWAEISRAQMKVVD